MLMLLAFCDKAKIALVLAGGWNSTALFGPT
jgi:hypothetical protein